MVSALTAGELTIGQAVPPFVGQTNQGQWQLTDFLGQQVIVYFYPKDNTPGCNNEAQDFNRAMPEIQSKNASVVGVSLDSLASHQKFSDKFGLTFPLIADEDKSISELFGVYQQKQFMGKTFMGIVRSTFVIDESGHLKHAWRQVKVKGHVDDVLSVL